MEQFLSLYRSVYSGNCWYGKNLRTTLADVPMSHRTASIHDGYNLSELLSHVIRWRLYVIDLVQERVHREVPDKENFPAIGACPDETWNGLIAEFHQTQISLVEALEGSSLDFKQESPKEGYTWGDICFGLMHHDIYHIGQINLLAKTALKN